MGWDTPRARLCLTWCRVGWLRAALMWFLLVLGQVTGASPLLRAEPPSARVPSLPSRPRRAPVHPLRVPAAAPTRVRVPRYRDDRLRQRTARAHVRSEPLAHRLLSFRPDWEHMVLLVDGPDDNPHNAYTVEAVRQLVTHLCKRVPAVVKIERSSRLSQGGLHLHLVVPRDVAQGLARRCIHVTPDGVIIRVRRLGRHPVRSGDAVGLTRLLRYLRKPAHAGASWFRATGPQHPKYLAAQAAVEAGLRMNRALGRRGLPRTLWTQHLPRLPPVVPPPCRSRQPRRPPEEVVQVPRVPAVNVALPVPPVPEIGVAVTFAPANLHLSTPDLRECRTLERTGGAQGQVGRKVSTSPRPVLDGRCWQTVRQWFSRLGCALTRLVGR